MVVYHSLRHIVACFPPAGTVETQKPRNTHATIEVTSVYYSLLGNASLVAT
jgi:hypothetical protein